MLGEEIITDLWKLVRPRFLVKLHFLPIAFFVYCINCKLVELYIVE